ncbi:hypothetical protein CA13_57450 [Planctomycetes bacterium CA13]|uniref:Uncharacterized protein n=1 Tax=Novipirellula herctigrandis TaxID=2527986 RepID=A0A5C5ZA79_9BACT|nr:hypothetical protein CA13_57450 [Planctomycetes bacterium CA13]
MSNKRFVSIGKRNNRQIFLKLVLHDGPSINKSLHCFAWGLFWGRIAVRADLVVSDQIAFHDAIEKILWPNLSYSQR